MEIGRMEIAIPRVSYIDEDRTANDEFEERFKITFDKLLKLNVILKLDPRYSNFILSNKTISNRRIGRKL